jgi:hypothetical protein
MWTRPGSFDLSSFWMVPFDLAGDVRPRRDDDVVAGAAGEQLGLDDLVVVVVVVDDLDAGLFGELGEDIGIDIVGPVVDVDDPLLGRGRGGEAERSEYDDDNRNQPGQITTHGYSPTHEETRPTDNPPPGATLRLIGEHPNRPGV